MLTTVPVKQLEQLHLDLGFQIHACIEQAATRQSGMRHQGPRTKPTGAADSALDCCPACLLPRPPQPKRQPQFWHIMHPSRRQDAALSCGGSNRNLSAAAAPCTPQSAKKRTTAAALPSRAYRLPFHLVKAAPRSAAAANSCKHHASLVMHSTIGCQHSTRCR